MTALVRIVLIDPSHPGNVGSVARAMKNMAISDLVLVRPRSFPHAESNALAAGPDDILANARVVSTVSEAVADCGFIAGTTSRPRSYYWEFTTPRDVAARIVGVPQQNRGGVVVRFRALRPRYRRPAVLQCLGAHSGEPRVLFPEPRDVRATPDL